jgi:hypothetical protein
MPAMIAARRPSIRGKGRRGRHHLGDGGDQGDQLPLAVAVAAGDLVLDHPDVAGLVLIQLVPGPGRAASTTAWEAHSLMVTTRTFGNAGRSASPASFPENPNAAAFSFVSGASHSSPSMLISRQAPRNAPQVSPHRASQHFHTPSVPASRAAGSS